MGNHPDMLCEVCTFDEGMVYPSRENMKKYAHICEARPGEKRCKFWDNFMMNNEDKCIKHCYGPPGGGLCSYREDWICNRNPCRVIYNGFEIRIIYEG